LRMVPIRCHSPFPFSRPRTRKRRKTLASLICPFAGSAIARSFGEACG
jgi:hypothetical protein